MKRCKCGSIKFEAPFEVVADYLFEGDFKAFELIGIRTFPDHSRCGFIRCAECTTEYENESDIPDAED